MLLDCYFPPNPAEEETEVVLVGYKDEACRQFRRIDSDRRYGGEDVEVEQRRRRRSVDTVTTSSSAGSPACSSSSASSLDTMELDDYGKFL